MCKTVEYGFGVVLCYNAVTDLMSYTYPSQDDNKEERSKKMVYIAISLTSVWRDFRREKECRAPFKETHCALYKVHPFLMADHFNRFTCFSAQKSFPPLSKMLCLSSQFTESKRRLTKRFMSSVLCGTEELLLVRALTFLNFQGLLPAHEHAAYKTLKERERNSILGLL